jgi:hypothetical protein
MAIQTLLASNRLAFRELRNPFEESLGSEYNNKPVGDIILSPDFIQDSNVIYFPQFSIPFLADGTIRTYCLEVLLVGNSPEQYL